MRLILLGIHLEFRKQNNIVVKQPLNPPTKEQHLLGLSLCFGSLQFESESQKIGLSTNYNFRTYLKYSLNYSGSPLQSILEVNCIFLFIILRYFSFLLFPGNPYQGSLPFKK